MVSTDALTHEHSVLKRVSRILDDRDDVGPTLRHIDQISSRSVCKFHSVHTAGRAHYVGHVTHCGACSCSEVQDLGSRLHVDSIDTACMGRRWGEYLVFTVNN